MNELGVSKSFLIVVLDATGLTITERTCSRTTSPLTVIETASGVFFAMEL